MPTDGRRALGALGERLAAAHLTAAGYRVIDRNARTSSGELDLVAVGHGCMVLCEVRARTAVTAALPGGALESIGPAKRRRLRRLAREWLAARAETVDALPPIDRLRFDAIGVAVARDGKLLALEHVEDAFG